MKPTIGRIVVYNTTHEEKMGLFQLGNNVQDKLPAVIVAVWDELEDSPINVKVMVDGSHPDIWRTSVRRGDAPGQWNWPEQV